MKYRIIGNMTGNSMDAIDLVITDFDGDKMTDVCSFSKPYTKDMQDKINTLRQQIRGKTRKQILALPHFSAIHHAYVTQVADCINEMLMRNHIDKATIDAIGFHGKTLDHNPPSVAKRNGSQPYTLQIGSGQMLANLTGIRVVYDFRSHLILNGFDGAPLVSPHNAHIAATEGDGCYYNGGNTSNFSWIIGHTAQIGTDAGPFNEYTDNFIRRYSSDTYDKNGKYGNKGCLDKKLLQKLFDKGRDFYELPLPKSGDPQYYHTDDIFDEIEKIYGKPIAGSPLFCNIVRTFEYFAAYIAVQALTLTNKKLALPPDIILFGGGWKNPIVRKTFDALIAGKSFVLPEHKKQWADFLARFHQKINVRYSPFGEMMEARLLADLARYKLSNKAWEIPETLHAHKKIVCGVIAKPQASFNPRFSKRPPSDCINLAAKLVERIRTR